MILYGPSTKQVVFHNQYCLSPPIDQALVALENRVQSRLRG